MEYFIFWLIVNVLVGYGLGKTRGQPGVGVAVSVLLGPIGWIAILVSSDMRPKCSECGGVVVLGARKCMHCGSDIGGYVGKSTVPGVPVKCPACGEAGWVKEVSEDSNIECPVCRRTFSGVRGMEEAEAGKFNRR
jgi:DNA-directed RNA polymerase subunit RPC12/RpoP